MSTRTLVCIPTYNEAENIVEILRRFDTVFQSIRDDFDCTILVIDDNSPDGTARIVESENLPGVLLLKREKKEGLGPAYLAGFSWGLERDFELYVECDADGSHQPEELPRLLNASLGTGLVIGTRWMDGGKVENWPLHRRAISRIGTKYAQVVLHLPYRDLTGGYRTISRAALEKIDIHSIKTLGYGFQIEMAMRIHDAGFAIAQVPITFIERKLGQSKMSKKIVGEALIKTSSWALRRVVNTR